MSDQGPVVCFCEVEEGMKARVVRTPFDRPEFRRLQEMGLVEGTEFLVLKVAPLGDPVEILVRGYRLCLRKHEAGNLLIEVLEP